MTAAKRRKMLFQPGARALKAKQRSSKRFRGRQEGATGYPLAGVPVIEGRVR
jgi:hypothetical protein